MWKTCLKILNWTRKENKKKGIKIRKCRGQVLDERPKRKKLLDKKHTKKRQKGEDVLDKRFLFFLFGVRKESALFLFKTQETTT